MIQMKDKFIRILSPMTLAVVILLDLAVVSLPSIG